MSRVSNYAKLFFFIFFVLVLKFCCEWTIYLLIAKYGLILPDNSPTPGSMSYWFFYQSPIVFKALYLLPFAYIEEVIFRYIPLALVLYFDKSRKFWPIVAVVSSFFFGWAHGSLGNVFVQGFGGLMFSVIFVAIYNFDHSRGEADSDRSLAKALMVTSVIHALYNLIALSI